MMIINYPDWQPPSPLPSHISRSDPIISKHEENYKNEK